MVSGEPGGPFGSPASDAAAVAAGLTVQTGGDPDQDVVEELGGFGTWMLDPVNQTLWCSRQTLRLNGMPLDQGPAPVWGLTEKVHPDDRPRIIEALGLALTGVPVREVAYRVLLGDGVTRYLLLRGATTAADGHTVVRGVAMDVTDAHEREGVLGDRVQRGQRAIAELRSTDEQKDLFLRTVSHDLRTPLTVIQGFASVLVNSDDDLSATDRRNYAERIERSARRLHAQLSDLLDLDRLARGVLEPARQPVELRALALEVIEVLNLGGRVAVPATLPTANVDPAYTARILENLLANASRHTPPDTHIELWVIEVDGGVLIGVDDDGPGVPAEDHEEIFNVFHKVRPQTAGTGVGLSLVRRFAELHGGRAWVEDRAGGGAAFRVLLADPTADPAADPA